MDLSDPQTNSNGLMSSDTTDNTSMITPSKRDIFLSTYQHQRLSLPNSIMNYIAKNQKVYQKMVKSCKYFFVKNPILVIDHLYYDRNGYEIWIRNYYKNIDLNTILCKLWITDKLYVYPKYVSNNSIASSIIRKIYRCDIKNIDISNQVISFHEFKFICSSVQYLTLERVTVKKFDGTVVSFEKLFEQIPNVKVINYTFTTPSNNTSKAGFKEFWKIPHLSNCDRFYLYNIPEDFDIDGFYSFMKKNKKTSVCLKFSDEVSGELKIRLKAIINDITATKNRGYEVRLM